MRACAVLGAVRLLNARDGEIGVRAVVRQPPFTIRPGTPVGRVLRRGKLGAAQISSPVILIIF